MNDTKNSKARGRPRQFDKEAALERAVELFQVRGFDGVGIAELCEAIGVKPPSLYAAFGSKAELYAQAIDHYSRCRGGFVAAAFEGGSALPEIVQDLLRLAVERYTEDEQQRGCLVMDAGPCADASACEQTAVRRKATQLFLEHQLAAFLPDNPEQVRPLALYLMTVMRGLSAAARDGETKADLLTTAESAASGFRSLLS